MRPVCGGSEQSKDDGVNEGDLDEASQFLIGKILVIRNASSISSKVVRSKFLIGKILAGRKFQVLRRGWPVSIPYR